MMLTRINFGLGILLAIVAALAVATDVDHSVPNVEFLPDMKRSPASGAFAASSVFPNGRTLQVPVTGTIARGDLPLHFAATKEDAIRAGEELPNPFAVADQSDVKSEELLSASKARGAEVYRVYCAACHGAAGAGDGPVAKRGFPPPPPLPTGKSVQMKDGQLFHILTYGQGSMSSMAAQVSRERRWDVINHIRTLQKVQP